MKCQYCPRRLRTKESKDRGYGLICGRKNGLIPPPAPRPAARPPAPTTTTTAPGIHPGQTTLPIQTEVPTEPT